MGSNRIISATGDPDLIAALIRGVDEVRFLLDAGSQFLHIAIPRDRIDIERLEIRGPSVQIEVDKDERFGFAFDCDKSALWIDRKEGEIVLTIHTSLEPRPNGKQVAP